MQCHTCPILENAVSHVCDINVCCLTLFTGEKSTNDAQKQTVAVSSQQDMWVLQMAAYVQTHTSRQSKRAGSTALQMLKAT